MKKIVFVTTMLSSGGSERVISLLAKKLIKHNYDVSIILLYSDKNDYIKEREIKVIPLNMRNSTKVGKVFNRLSQLRKVISQLNPDLVISFDSIVNLYTILSTVKMSIPLLISERNDPNQYPEIYLMRKFRDYLYKYVNKIVFQTEDAMNYFTKDVRIKGTVIPNPIKEGLPYWKDFKQESKIITASRLHTQKNLPMLINAFAEIEVKYPEYKLIIFGVGELKNELELLVTKKKLSNKVSFPGFSNNIHEEMATASMFVISSNYEGISNSMLEALAIGVPVISTDSPIGGAKMFINNNKNGVLVDVGATSQLVNAIEKIISNEEFAQEISGNATEVRDSLTEDLIIKKWIDVIEK